MRRSRRFQPTVDSLMSRIVLSDITNMGAIAPVDAPAPPPTETSTLTGPDGMPITTSSPSGTSSNPPAATSGLTGPDGMPITTSSPSGTSSTTPAVVASSNTASNSTLTS